MTKEQIEELAKALAAMREAIAESEALIEDYSQCRSDISRKYLAAAVKKHASRITSLIPQGLFDQQQA